MEISSEVFEPGEDIPVVYSCDGENINPPLHISEVPEEAQSLALIMDDPDAAGGSFAHWVVWNIDPKSADISEGKVPEGAAQGLNGTGLRSYSGPCPPEGVHRYFFKVYALDTKLNPPEPVTAEDLEDSMDGHILAQAEIYGRYGREEGGEDETETLP